MSFEEKFRTLASDLKKSYSAYAALILVISHKIAVASTQRSLLKNYIQLGCSSSTESTTSYIQGV